MTLREPQPFSRGVPVSEARLIQANMVKALQQKPMTTPELAKLIKYSENMTLRWLKDIEGIDVYGVERMPNNPRYWQPKGHKYVINLQDTNIRNIPHVFFREIPILRSWVNWARGRENATKLLGVFENICYGEVVESFKRNPEHWKHPTDTQLFYDQYKEQYGAEPKESVVKAMRNFLTVCLKQNLTRGAGNTIQFKMMGLHVEAPKGQYAYIKLSAEDRQKAIDWLASPEAAAFIESDEVELKPDRVQAHFAFSLEGFPRPSRVLTIEVQRIDKYKADNGQPVFEWMQIETKQNKFYQKFMKDPQLVAWADRWIDIRRRLDYRYLFLDENDYKIKVNDTSELYDVRAPFAKVYKKMFGPDVLNKRDSYFFTDTLYALRHCGVHLWLERTGYNYDIVTSMGWENTDTLRKFYGTLGNQDLRRYVLKGTL